MDRKMIFFDVDGTIVSHRDYHISESTIRAIKKAQQNGHLAFVNTGRTPAEIERAITDVGFDGYVCGCGTHITLGSNVLLSQLLSPELVQHLIEDFRSYRLEAILEGTRALYYDTRLMNPYLLQIRDLQLHKHGFPISTFEDPSIECNKFCVIPEVNGDMQGFYEKYKDLFEFIDRGFNFYEIVPAGFSKATGIRFLEEHLGIPHENTYALGDSSNDLSMLNYVNTSIAMGNSQEAILNLASFVTADVDQNGVELALQHFRLI